MLDGAGRGADTMTGGAGNDTYYVDSSGDSVAGESSASSGGVDTVISSVDWSASGKYVENLTAATGTAGVDLTGNGLVNVLTGNDGKNVLDGGAGADVLKGGKGNDTYIVDNAKDSVEGESSTSAGGVDLVKASVTGRWPATTWKTSR
ncbi:hypothetical protein HK414_05245 [Ramlibacter terrae]|uniref:Calcium-binding protein n=1 Tax=Ramlibacter terrae TaxID=2732511 RepID=A0ABX6P1U6_9BURK|nr:hypothetical protein HK414_05245 [Ramlibacter terrae]